jgi:uncharacterized protein YbbC (DUF1343 family)
MPTPETAMVYPGACLLEATNASEGRGSTKPFELFGAGYVDGPALAKAMQRDGGAGFIARPTTFRPTFHKWAGQPIGAVQVHVTEPERFEPYRAYLSAIAHLRTRKGFAWRTEKYEFVDSVPAMDLLTGDPRVREAIDSGASIEELMAIGADRTRAWDARSRWLY